MMTFLLLFVLLLPSPLADGQQTEIQSQLTRAEATWRKQALNRYEFSVEVRCFCGLTGDQMRFRVENGKSTPILVPSVYLEVQLTNEVNSIERLFSLLHRLSAGNPDRFAIQFDSERGFPTNVDYDHRRNTSDDELFIRVLNFAALGKGAFHDPSPTHR